jgi:deoxycytidylate deaminase
MGIFTKVDKLFESREFFSINIQSIKKWMKVAKIIKEVENPCYSRAIGAIIVDPSANVIISSGHNGPPANCPPNDDPGYLREVVWNKLDSYEKSVVKRKLYPSDGISEGCRDVSEKELCENFVSSYGNCKTCPRKHVDAPSGKRLELCSCIHGETDAICKAKAAGSKLLGAVMFAYCGVPCVECTKLCINSCLDVVFCLDHGGEDYSPYSSRWLFDNSKTSLVLMKEDWIHS